jgi:predicted naringenin-chalcone synthase
VQNWLLLISDIIHPFLEKKNNLKMEDIDHLIFHPGGKKNRSNHWKKFIF